MREILQENVPLQLLDELACLFNDGNLDERDYRDIHGLLQRTDITLDALGANIVRGIDRAKSLQMKPSIFNVGNWLWNGWQDPLLYWEYIAGIRSAPTTFLPAEHSVYAHGWAMVDNFQKAANELSVTPRNYNLYNKLPNNLRFDEAVFVECEVNLSYNTATILAWVQNPRCGKWHMNWSEFTQQYSPYLQAAGITDLGWPPKK
jgi:hypothetical protein